MENLDLIGTRILPSGFRVLGYASLTEDVEGQIQRGKLNLANDEKAVLEILPTIEDAMHGHGFVYAHCALTSVYASHLSVIERGGHPYRLAIIAPARWENINTPSYLHLDTDWIEVEHRAPSEQYSDRIPLLRSTSREQINDFFQRIPR